MRQVKRHDPYWAPEPFDPASELCVTCGHRYEDHTEHGDCRHKDCPCVAYLPADAYTEADIKSALADVRLHARREGEP